MDVFREKYTPQRDCGPSQKVRAPPRYGVVSFYRAGLFHSLMSQSSIPVILVKGRGFLGIRPHPFFDLYGQLKLSSSCECVTESILSFKV